MIDMNIVERWFDLHRSNFPDEDAAQEIIDTVHDLGGVCWKTMRDTVIRHDFDRLRPDYKSQNALLNHLEEEFNLSSINIYYIVYPEKRKR